MTRKPSLPGVKQFSASVTVPGDARLIRQIKRDLRAMFKRMQSPPHPMAYLLDMDLGPKVKVTLNADGTATIGGLAPLIMPPYGTNAIAPKRARRKG